MCVCGVLLLFYFVPSSQFLTSSDYSSQFSWQGFLEAFCPFLFPRAENKRLAQGHSGGFVPKVGLETRPVSDLML